MPNVAARIPPVSLQQRGTPQQKTTTETLLSQRSSYCAPHGRHPATEASTDRAMFLRNLCPRGDARYLPATCRSDNMRVWLIARPLVGFAETFLCSNRRTGAQQWRRRQTSGAGSDAGARCLFVVEAGLTLPVNPPCGCAFIPPGASYKDCAIPHRPAPASTGSQALPEGSAACRCGSNCVSNEAGHQPLVSTGRLKAAGAPPLQSALRRRAPRVNMSS